MVERAGWRTCGQGEWKVLGDWLVTRAGPGLRRMPAQAPVPAGRESRGLRARPLGHVDGSVVALTAVIAYDISEDRRRARTAATLQQWGDRVQRSVFVCTMEPAALAELLERVGDIINVDTDSVYCFRQCAPCWDAVHVLGQASVEEEPLFWAVL